MLDIYTPADTRPGVLLLTTFPYPDWHVPAEMVDSFRFHHENLFNMQGSPWLRKLQLRLDSLGYGVLNPTGSLSLAQLKNLWDRVLPNFPPWTLQPIPDNPFTGSPFGNSDFAHWWLLRMREGPDANGDITEPAPQWTYLPRFITEVEDKSEGGVPILIPKQVPTELPDEDSYERLQIEITNYLLRAIYHCRIALSIHKAVTFGQWGGRPTKKPPGA